MRRKLVFLATLAAMASPTFALSVNWAAGNPSNWYLDTAGEAPDFQTLNLADATIPNQVQIYIEPPGTDEGLGQMFLTTTPMTVRGISFLASNVVAATYNFEVYDVEEGIGEGRHRPDPWDIASAVELVWSGSATTSGVSDKNLVLLNLDESEAFTLYAGEKYAFLITADVSIPFAWYRSEAAGTFPGMMIASDATAGGGNLWRNIMDYGGPPTTDSNNVRQASLALYDHNVPEPATIALLGLGILALRRKK